MRLGRWGEKETIIKLMSYIIVISVTHNMMQSTPEREGESPDVVETGNGEEAEVMFVVVLVLIHIKCLILLYYIILG